MKKKKVLILCTGNSCRSQMAEGWIRYYAGDAADVYSAGTEAHGLNKYAVKSMMDAVLDISHQKSKTVDELPQISFDYVITICDELKEACPYFPGGGEQIHYSFPDPARATGTEEEILKVFNAVRDDIEDFAFDFVHNKIRCLIPENIEELI
jgi:arsenate reductase (thioredoxin)